MPAESQQYLSPAFQAQALAEFLARHVKPFDPETDDYDRPLFAQDIKEGKNDPIYNAHSYHTKVPHKAIVRYILHYTAPGDLVFDGFCGTGMTGVAAQWCGAAPLAYPRQQISFSVPSKRRCSSSRISPNYRVANCSSP